jgi:hypothetical protein
LKATKRTTTMGILKHFVLPIFCLYRAGIVIIGLTQGKDGVAKVANFPIGEDGMTPVETHMMGAFVGLSAALLFNAIAAIMTENSHYRAMATAVEFIISATDAYDTLYLAGPGFDATFLIGCSLLAGVGLAVHSREPGIFTKDKKNKND